MPSIRTASRTLLGGVLLLLALAATGLGADGFDPKEHEASLLPAVPAARKGILATIPAAERPLFLTYAATLPIGADIRPDDPSVSVWFAPEDLARMTRWPAEMKAALAGQRRKAIAGVPVLAGCTSLAAAQAEIAKADPSPMPLADPDANLAVIMLPFEVRMLQFSHHLAEAAMRVPPGNLQPEAQAPAAPAARLPAKEIAGIKEILRILRRGPGVVPDKREAAAARVAEIMATLAPATAAAIAPTINYDLGRMYLGDWGPDKGRVADMATAYFRKATAAYQGRISLEALSHQASQVNVSHGDAKALVAYYKTVTAFIATGTADAVFPYLPPDAVIDRQTLLYDREVLEQIVASVKANAGPFLALVTDDWTLKRFAASPEALDYIIASLPADDRLAVVARALKDPPAIK